MDLSKVYEGWKNHLFPDEYMKEQIDVVSSERMAICRECPLNSKNNPDSNPLRFDEHCTKCGCTLAAKTKCLSCGCPIHRWGALVTPEEEQKMKSDEK